MQRLNRDDLEDDARGYLRSLATRISHACRDHARLQEISGKLPVRESMELRGCLDDLKALRLRIRDFERRVAAKRDGELVP